MTRRAFVVLLVLLPALLPACSVVQKVSDIVSPTMVVASDLDNPPFAFLDLNGQPDGRDVEMMNRLAEEVGVAIEWKQMQFADLLPACEKGAVDVVCATLGITPERERHVLFTTPYFDTRIAVLVRAGAGEPTSLADLAGKRVAAGTGTTAERAVKLYLKQSNGVFENPAKTPSKDRLLAREIDAAAMDGPAAEDAAAKSEGKLAVLRESLAVERYALALPQDRPRLRTQLDEALSKMKKLRILAHLDEKWGLVRQ